MAVQTTYGQTHAVGFPGLIYDMRNITVESYACESTSIPFGGAVTAGTDKRKQVKDSAGGGAFTGIAIHEYAHEADITTGQAAYLLKETVNVLRKGAVWVQTNGTVAQDAEAFYVTSGTDRGLWGSAGTTSTGKFRSATTGSGLAIVEIDL